MYSRDVMDPKGLSSDLIKAAPLIFKLIQLQDGGSAGVKTLRSYRPYHTHFFGLEGGVRPEDRALRLW